MRQNVGTDHDAALDFRAKPFGPGLFVHVHQVAVLRRAVAKFHAVKAAQVGAGFGGRDDVVDGNRELGARQRHVHQGGAKFLQLAQGQTHRGFDITGQALRKKLFGQAHAQTQQGLSRRGTRARRLHLGVEVLRWALRTGGVALIKTAHGREHQGAVFSAARHGPGLIQTGRKGHHAIARANAVGGFDAGDAAKAGRLTNGAARVSARAGGQQACGHGGGAGAR